MTITPPRYNVERGLENLKVMGNCQGMSKTGSVLDIWVPAELQQIYGGALKGNTSLLNA